MILLCFVLVMIGWGLLGLLVVMIDAFFEEEGDGRGGTASVWPFEEEDPRPKKHDVSSGEKWP
jgi:hypothetical protein